MEYETRIIPAELRAENTAEGRILSGYAAIFNSASEDLGGFNEVIEPGAFADAIANDDIRALFNHDPSLILGRNRSGTLRLAEDSHGLHFEIDLPNTEYAAGLWAVVARGDVSQCSFSFTIRPGGESWAPPAPGTLARRRLLSVSLRDVGPVTYPAYRATVVAARAIATAAELRQTTINGGPDRAIAAAAIDMARARQRMILIQRMKVQ